MGGQCRSAVATAFLVGGCWLAIATPAAACGPDSDCQVDGRSYRVVVPAVADAPRGAIIFAHGYRGSAAGSLGNPGLAGLADSLGVVVAAAQATGPEWSVPGVPSDDAVTGVDELAYVEAIADDLARRLDVDRERIVVSGFSSGAMLVWHLACHGGDRFAGFVPLSGTFWQPLPERCPTSSVNLVHYHGDADAIVPLAGRPIKDAHQGDVEAALALLVEGGGYEPAPASAPAGLRCSGYRNSAGKRLELCLFAGGHSFDPSYLARAWQLLVPTDAG